MNLSRDHLSINQIADLVEDRLPPDERSSFEAHIAVCSRCSSDLSRLKHLIGVMRSDSSEDAPPSFIARAVRLFRSRSAVSPADPGSRRHVQAVLRFDSNNFAPAFGVRSGGPGARQLLFYGVALGNDLQIYEIDLRMENSGQSWIVSGQVFGQAAEGGKARLQSATSKKSALLNDQCEFNLPPVEAGTYRLVLSLADVDVEVNELKVGV
jgi:hypothetical protein